MKKLTCLLCAFLVIVALSAFKQDRVRTVFMIGDSTMANKDYSNGKKERGWGMALQCYFDDNIRVDNHAKNGRSSKSFIDEGLWKKVIDQVKPGDYVVIQFGHNDEKPALKRHTDPGSTFDENLRMFCLKTREKGGIPILMNCVVRRNYFKIVPQNDDDEALRKTVGAIPGVQAKEEGDTLVDTHGDYRWAPRNVAEELGVAFIDANTITHNLEQELGREASKKLHMWFLPGEEPSIPKGRQDNTHYNVYGAHTVAKLLAKAIGEEVPALKERLVFYDMSVAKNGIAEYFSPQDAVDAAPAGKETIVQIFPGEWTKPNISADKNIKFVMREGASWK